MGIRLTETFAMSPAASVCGLYFAHPQARYFALGGSSATRCVDYHRRKGLELRAVERWLAPNLNYEPEGGRTRREAAACSTRRCRSTPRTTPSWR